MFIDMKEIELKNGCNRVSVNAYSFINFVLMDERILSSSPRTVIDDVLIQFGIFASDGTVIVSCPTVFGSENKFIRITTNNDSLIGFQLKSDNYKEAIIEVLI